MLKLPWPSSSLPASHRVKLGAYTPRLNVVVALNEPEVPVIVKVYCPTGAVLLAVSVSTLYPIVGFGANDAVTPLGRPDVTAKFTLPVNPYWGFTLTEVVPELFWPMLRLPAQRVNVGP